MIGYLLFIVLGFQNYQPPILELEISGIKQVKGNVLVAVYNDADEFLGEQVIASSSITVTSTKVFGELHLPFGAYAISVFHDTNEDGELNTLFGIPKEPYGFSNNAKGRFGPPGFEKVLFDFNQDRQKMQIRLQ